MLEHEEQRYGRNKETIVNHSYIESGEYRRKFDEISDNADLNRLLYQIAKKILNHRSGTLYEDMYWIDAEAVTVVAKLIDSTQEGGVSYTSSISRVIDKYDGLITIHSHPHSTVPSCNDLFCNYNFGYALGIVVCHDGTIYMYSTEEYIREEYYKMAAGNLIRQGIAEDVAFRMILDKLHQNGRIFFKEVTVDDV